MFTDGQKARMRTALTSNVGGRSNLITPINHATGIDVAPPFVKLIFLLKGILPVLETAFYLRITLIMHPLLGIGYLKGGSRFFYA